MTPEQAEKLRALIAHHANAHYQAGLLDRRQDHEKRAKVQAATEETTRALCAALTEMTLEKTNHEE